MFQQRDTWWDLIVILDLPNNTVTVQSAEEKRIEDAIAKGKPIPSQHASSQSTTSSSSAVSSNLTGVSTNPLSAEEANSNGTAALSSDHAMELVVSGLAAQESCDLKFITAVHAGLSSAKLTESDVRLLFRYHTEMILQQAFDIEADLYSPIPGSVSVQTLSASYLISDSVISATDGDCLDIAALSISSPSSKTKGKRSLGDKLLSASSKIKAKLSSAKKSSGKLATRIMRGTAAKGSKDNGNGNDNGNGDGSREVEDVSIEPEDAASAAVGEILPSTSSSSSSSSDINQEEGTSVLAGQVAVDSEYEESEDVTTKDNENDEEADGDANAQAGNAAKNIGKYVITTGFSTKMRRLYNANKLRAKKLLTTSEVSSMPRSPWIWCTRSDDSSLAYNEAVVGGSSDSSHSHDIDAETALYPVRNFIRRLLCEVEVSSSDEIRAIFECIHASICIKSDDESDVPAPPMFHMAKHASLFPKSLPQAERNAQALLSFLPIEPIALSANGGVLYPIAVGLFHRHPSVKKHAVGILNKMLHLFPSTAFAVKALGKMILLTLERLTSKLESGALLVEEEETLHAEKVERLRQEELARLREIERQKLLERQAEMEMEAQREKLAASAALTESSNTNANTAGSGKAAQSSDISSTITSSIFQMKAFVEKGVASMSDILAEESAARETETDAQKTSYYSPLDY
jgi:hypothetical protein